MISTRSTLSNLLEYSYDSYICKHSTLILYQLVSDNKLIAVMLCKNCQLNYQVERPFIGNNQCNHKFIKFNNDWHYCCCLDCSDINMVRTKEPPYSLTIFKDITTLWEYNGIQNSLMYLCNKDRDYIREADYD
jgi:hypothetical protein